MDDLKQQFLDSLEPFYFEKIHCHAITVWDFALHNPIIHFSDIEKVYFHYSVIENEKEHHTYSLFEYKEKIILFHLIDDAFLTTHMFVGNNINEIIDAFTNSQKKLDDVSASYHFNSNSYQEHYDKMRSYLEKILLDELTQAKEIKSTQKIKI